MKKVVALAIIILVACSALCHAKTKAIATWVSGSNTRYQPGVYGTKGQADPNNVPGARYRSVSWTGSDGNFWLFGGIGNDVSGHQGSLNDLWKFDGTNWTWISGSQYKNQTGIYGVKGIPDPANTPGARNGSISWVNSDGSLWLYGGAGYGSFLSYGQRRDMWKFDGTNWTSISGPDIGYQNTVYGEKGVADPNNTPGTRSNSSSWLDSDGNLWVLGGLGYGIDGYGGSLNDLWKYDGTNWTWINGGQVRLQPGIYGEKGVADPDNVPGSRANSVTWIDSDDNLWLFGGAGNHGAFNDLWKFDGTNWTWMSGSNKTNQNGTYGTKGIANPENIPRASEQGVSWTDSNGNFWLFGGEGFGSIRLNDLWKFDGTNWTWVGGSNSPNRKGIYGTKGIADPENAPGAREQSVSWANSTDNLWLFGGYGYDDMSVSYGNLNDLWKIEVYEVHYVDDSATGDNNGSTWEDAFVGLQPALDVAVAYDKIYVAEGTYYPDPNGLADPQLACFQMKNNVEIYGGFPVGGSDFVGRDPNQFETILSGDLLKDDNPATRVWELPDDPTRADNCWNVFYHPDGLGLDNSAVLDGFTITGAFDSGMWNWSSSPTVSDCIFTLNSGMGMENSEDSDPSITNCTFTLNSYGGMGNEEYSNPVITGCTFFSNFFWGIANLMYSSPTVTDCTFTYNPGPVDYAGGMGNSWYSSPTVTNCIFTGNFRGSAQGWTGMVNNQYCSPTVISCNFYGISFRTIENDSSDLKIINSTFIANSGVIYNDNHSDTELTNCTFASSLYNETIYNGDYSNVTLTNCILRKEADYAGYLLDNHGVLNVNYCNIQGGLSSITGDADKINWNHGNIDADPVFVRNPDDGGDGWFDGSGAGAGPGQNNDVGDLRLMPQSPCIDAGTQDFKLPIINERHPFGDGVVTLDEQNVDTATIVVMDLARSDIYTEGDDYDIVVVGDQVEIHAKLTGSVLPNISEGQPFSVDYEFYLNIADFSTDFDGLPRFVDGDCDTAATADVGAYEFDWLYVGDFAGGCDINLGDFAVLAQNWQDDNPAMDIAPYLDPDGIIDLQELLIMSEHWLNRIILADFTKNGRVDLGDMAVLNQYWLQNNPEMDIAPSGSPDGIIDLGELLMLAENWLDQTTWY